MLRTKLFRGFALVVVLFSVLSSFVGIRLIKQRVVDEAQNRVRLDLGSAWAVYNAQLHEIETIVRLAATKSAVVATCEEERWDDPDLQARLERIRVTFGLDFLDLLTPKGEVRLRTTQPYATGDHRVSDPAVIEALKGKPLACMVALSRQELEMEGDGLAERAFLQLEDTPHARKTERQAENRGMVMVAAAPVWERGQVLGVVYGGILVNRNNSLVDRIHDVVFKNENFEGVPVGTATIFLHDSRIATTVRLANGNRALGTRVSKQVADRVLDNGEPWIGEAFVVREWYLTAYDPIRDGSGRIIGMLYVGILKKPFEVMGRNIVLQFIVISIFALFVALVLAFIIAGRLAQPIHRLVAASNRMSQGERPGPVLTDGACHETEALIVAFNAMASTLAEREEKLKALNRSYMETLGFVSHELKSPVATMMNYSYLLRERKLGPLSEKQEKAVRAIDAGGNRLVEMVRHYLNLSRIENRELQPVRTRVPVLAEVLVPLIETAEAEIAAKRMRLVNNVSPEVVLEADMNMTREIFENLISNAVKYGVEGGTIRIGSSPANGLVEFSVWNEGEGIPPDRVGDLFKKFSRIESRGGRREKGTGLGLFITKHIVEAHGGTIRADSKAGEWVEFVFTLPRFRQEAGEA